MKVIVLAEGIEPQFSSYTRSKCPKNFLPLVDHLSFFQKNVQMFLSATFIEDILVLTNPKYISLVEKQLLLIDPDRRSHVIVEPYSKKGAPAVSLGLIYLQEKLKASLDSKVLVIPSDGVMPDEERFLNHLKRVDEIYQENKIIVFETESLNSFFKHPFTKTEKKKEGFCCSLDCFFSKPHPSGPYKSYVIEKGCSSSGIFFFSIQTFWQELKEHCLEIYELSRGNYLNAFNHFFRMPEISFEKAIVEKTKEGVLYSFDSGGSDVVSLNPSCEMRENEWEHFLKKRKVLETDAPNDKNKIEKATVFPTKIEDVDERDIFGLVPKKSDQLVNELLHELRTS